MTTVRDSETSAALSPDEAFAILGDETRLTILRRLAEADEPLSFSELYDRVEYGGSSNFGYHLEKLVGHFVRKTYDGYDLWEAGRRVVESVLSGAVTETPVIEPTETDKRCPFCSAPIEVGFQDARVELNCTECPGLAEKMNSGGRRFSDHGALGYFLIPPAGVRGRTASEALEAAWTWRHVDFVADSSGVCSRCSASLEFSVTVCEDHEGTDSYCERCGRRYAARFDLHCENCHYDAKSIAPGCLLDTTELLAFLAGHGVNPLAPDAFDRAMDALAHYDETIHSADPFEASFTFTVDDDALTVTIDDNLAVVDVERSRAGKTG